MPPVAWIISLARGGSEPCIQVGKTLFEGKKGIFAPKNISESTSIVIVTSDCSVVHGWKVGWPPMLTDYLYSMGISILNKSWNHN